MNWVLSASVAKRQWHPPSLCQMSGEWLGLATRRGAEQVARSAASAAEVQDSCASRKQFTFSSPALPSLSHADTALRAVSRLARRFRAHRVAWKTWGCDARTGDNRDKSSTDGYGFQQAELLNFSFRWHTRANSFTSIKRAARPLLPWKQMWQQASAKIPKSPHHFIIFCTLEFTLVFDLTSFPTHPSRVAGRDGLEFSTPRKLHGDHDDAI